MKIKHTIYLVSILFLISCSGIGGTGGTVDDTVTGAKTQKVFKGSVSQVSTKDQEITVNGVQFKHTEAVITRDTVVLSASEIKAGQIITVDALDSDKDGIYEASKIVIEEQLRGPIQSIDLVLSTIQLLGQTISVTEATSFTSKSLATLEVNNFIAVFGFRREDNVLEATLIEIVKKEFSSTVDTVKVGGEVTSINLTSQTVTIDGVEVEVGLQQIKNIEVGDVISLDNIEINTSVPDGLATNNTEPSKVVEDEEYEIDREIVLEGIPRRISARNVFSLNGFQVFVPLDLMNEANIESVKNKRLVIEGVIVGKNEVLAKKIKAEKIKDFELRGLLEATSQEGAIIVFGQIILIDRFTFINFELESAFSEIAAGSKTYAVFVKGYVNANGNKVAGSISLKIEDTEQKRIIEGKIESITEGIIKVSGVSIKLRALVDYRNQNKIIEGVALLRLLSVGDEIVVTGEYSQDKIFLVNSLKNSSLTSSEEEEVQINPDSIKIKNPFSTRRKSNE
jgi:hypothetical protein